MTRPDHPHTHHPISSASPAAFGFSAGVMSPPRACVRLDCVPPVDWVLLVGLVGSAGVSEVVGCLLGPAPFLSGQSV